MFKKLYNWFNPTYQKSLSYECLILTYNEVEQFNNAFDISDNIREQLFQEDGQYLLPLTIKQFKQLQKAFNLPDSIKEKIKIVLEGK